MMHLIALRRILVMEYSTNRISLGMDYKTAKEVLDAAEATGDGESAGFQARYRLRWREPNRRLSESIHGLWKDFVVFMLTGWGSDERDAIGGVPSSVPGRKLATKLSEDPHMMVQQEAGFKQPSLPKILSLVEQDMVRHPNTPRSDRSTWAANATFRMAEIHKENYDKKNFDVSLQQPA